MWNGYNLRRPREIYVYRGKLGKTGRVGKTGTSPLAQTVGASNLLLWLVICRVVLGCVVKAEVRILNRLWKIVEKLKTCLALKAEQLCFVAFSDLTVSYFVLEIWQEFRLRVPPKCVCWRMNPLIWCSEAVWYPYWQPNGVRRASMVTECKPSDIVILRLLTVFYIICNAFPSKLFK